MNENINDGLKVMLNLVDSLPGHLNASPELNGISEITPSNNFPRRLVLCAMGGSAIGGDLVQGLLKHQKTSLDVWRDYGLPHWVTSDDLVIAASYSGNTEECLSAASEARKRGVKILFITSGGQLENLVKAGENLVRLPGGLPPRAALGHSLGALLGVLNGLGLLENHSEEIAEAVDLMENGPTCHGPTAEELAVSLENRIPVIYAEDSFVEGIALRWKGQLNENAKVPALMATFPELNHNDIVGWGLPKNWQDRFVLIILRSGEGNDRIQQRISLTSELLKDEFAAVHTINAAGKSTLAKLMSLVQYGDYVSCYLAGLRGVDPMPVHRIDQLKSGLSKTDS